jgi:L-fuconolactonase
MGRIIDSHQHFWKYVPEEYDWITPEMSVLRRDFLPRDLKAAGGDLSIAVQARQTVEETRWLLELADANESIAGVVGWVPLTAPDARSHIERFAGQPKLVSLRHIVQDEPDEQYLLRPDFNRGVAALREFDLVYDILIFERHLATAIAFVDQHPSQVFVLDHIAKPRIREAVFSPWCERIRELACRANVYCKLSGMLTEADHKRWEAADLEPYFDVVLESFGPKRLMFGSDWPVLLLAGNYQGWVSIVKNAIERLTETEQDRIWRGTAMEAYDFGSVDSGPRSA